MSLEDQVEKLNANFDKLFAQLGVGGTTKPPRGDKKGPTIEAVKALAEKLRDLTDKSDVVKLLKKIGGKGCTAVANLEPKQYPAAITALEAAIKEAEEDSGDDEDDDDDDDC